MSVINEEARPHLAIYKAKDFLIFGIDRFHAFACGVTKILNINIEVVQRTSQKYQ